MDKGVLYIGNYGNNRDAMPDAENGMNIILKQIQNAMDALFFGILPFILTYV